MIEMTSTKMSKGGQTTVPKEIRAALGIEDLGRVYWYWDGKHAYITGFPLPPLSIDSESGFWARIEEAEEDVRRGRVAPAASASSELRKKYGL